MLCESQVCPAVDKIVGVVNAGGSMDLERGHHHLNQPGRKRVIEPDPVMLLDEASPSEADVLMRQVGLSVHLAALGHYEGNFRRHFFL